MEYLDEIKLDLDGHNILKINYVLALLEDEKRSNIERGLKYKKARWGNNAKRNKTLSNKSNKKR